MRIITLMALALLSTSLFSQYLEEFTGQDGAGLVSASCTGTAITTCSPSANLSGVDWNISSANWSGFDSSSPDDFGVVGGSFQANDIDNEACWESPVLDISMVSGSFSFSVDIDRGGDLENSDYVDVKYSVDGGAFITVTNWNGFGSTTHTLIGDCTGCPDATDFGMQTVSVAGLTGSSTFEIVICVDNGASSEFIFFDNINVPQANVKILPVEFASFKAHLNQNIVELDWTTASEINNDYFVIERSGNGMDFEQIGTLKGEGNTSYLTTYQFNDKSPLQHSNYYRLKQVDYDGKFNYSKTVSVDYQSVKSLSVYPNPASDLINISHGGDDFSSLDIRVYDLTGRLMLKENNIGATVNNLALDVSGLNAGVYKIEVINLKGEYYSQLFIKE